MQLTLKGFPETSSGFTYLWGKYVRGFDARQHCARCLIGDYSQVVTKTMQPGTYELDLPARPFDFFYLCGVSKRGYANNLHLAVRPSAGCSARAYTFNGGEFAISGALAVVIAPPHFTQETRKQWLTCRNWQFGHGQYAGA